MKWAYNTGCEGFDKRSNRFVIELQNIFDEVLLVDTVDGFNYTLNPKYLDSSTGLSVFYVREVVDDNKYSIGLKTSKSKNSIVPENPIDRLNTYLLNGYLLNALAVIEKLKRQDLLPEISMQLSLLFPPNYADNRDFFNCYLSAESGRLITMPYVAGLDDLVKNLNKQTVKESIKHPFNIGLVVSPDNQIVSYDTESTIHQEMLTKLIENLSFKTNFSENVMVFIKVDTSDKGEKYEISNQRALIDPNSKSFRKQSPYRGTVH